MARKTRTDKVIIADSSRRKQKKKGNLSAAS